MRNGRKFCLLTYTRLPERRPQTEHLPGNIGMQILKELITVQCVAINFFFRMQNFQVLAVGPAFSNPYGPPAWYTSPIIHIICKELRWNVPGAILILVTFLTTDHLPHTSGVVCTSSLWILNPWKDSRGGIMFLNRSSSRWF